MTIGELIRQQRKKYDLTLDDVGKACGVPRSTVSRWENGKIKKITSDKQEQLCITLHIDPAIFFRREEILTKEEMEIVTAFRESDSRAREDALKMLKEHKKSGVAVKVG